MASNLLYDARLSQAVVAPSAADRIMTGRSVDSVRRAEAEWSAVRESLHTRLDDHIAKRLSAGNCWGWGALRGESRARR